MFEKIRNKYLYNKTQIIELDSYGNVIKSDNLLYTIPLNSSIATFHPFFETVLSLLEIKEEEFTFNCIHLDVDTIKKSVDVIFNSGSLKTNPILILFDFTEHYTNFQSISQEKNESILGFHLEEMKNQQLETEKNFKNKFLANVSHDLKTPLGASLWFIGMLEKSTNSDQQKELLSLLKETTNHVKGLVDDILDLSKIELGIIKINETKIDFLKLLLQIEKTIAPKAKEKNLDFILNIDSELPQFISADKLRITQIIINLLDNAIKFTKVGSVSLSVLLISKSKNSALISIIVTDTGTGIKFNNKNDVYQSFKKLHHSRKMEGSGLGLSIVSQLLEMMDGTIDYESELNKGTIFKIQLPIKIVTEKA